MEPRNPPGRFFGENPRERRPKPRKSPQRQKNSLIRIRLVLRSKSVPRPTPF
ncbi:unnamed protein product [Penicillium salamii]|uniref:Uncharacterized protein n=1 Tax=Penicillium salamii TaxID=1612424 RepID=A0A9W4I834_9EURO|nr:unnamed protein product [Penicillium salamii]